MSDLLFTAGLDDRAYQDALNRIDRGTARTSRGVERMQRLFMGGALANRVGGAITGALEAAAEQSEAAAKNMKLFSESWNGLKADVGMDLQPFVQDITELVKAVRGGRNEAVNGAIKGASWYERLVMGDELVDAAYGSGDGEGPDAVDRERKRISEQEREIRRSSTLREEQARSMEELAKAHGAESGGGGAGAACARPRTCGISPRSIRSRARRRSVNATGRSSSGWGSRTATPRSINSTSNRG
jgi:hypothetical protein